MQCQRRRIRNKPTLSTVPISSSLTKSRPVSRRLPYRRVRPKLGFIKNPDPPTDVLLFVAHVNGHERHGQNLSTKCGVFTGFRRKSQLTEDQLTLAALAGGDQFALQF